MPPEKFQATFGLSWGKALADGVVYNAIDACKVLDVDSDGLGEFCIYSSATFSFSFVDELFQISQTNFGGRARK